MKRDLDLARKLLLDIESRGADCSVSVLRCDSDHDLQERIRYHLRLLIDAGLLKEVDRTTSGIPCLRLTHDGHELLELARSESRWNEAKWICQQRLGGLSLTVIRDILSRWVIGAYRLRRPYSSRRLRYEPEAYRHYVDHVDDGAHAVDDLRYVRVRGEADAEEVVDLEFDRLLPADLI